jgi:hypothetical protein
MRRLRSLEFQYGDRVHGDPGYCRTRANAARFGSWLDGRLRSVGAGNSPGSNHGSATGMKRLERLELRGVAEQAAFRP